MDTYHMRQEYKHYITQLVTVKLNKMKWEWWKTILH